MILGARADGDEITDEFAYCVIDAMKEGTGLEYDVLLSELIADEEFIEEGEILKIDTRSQEYVSRVK